MNDWLDDPDNEIRERDYRRRRLVRGIRGWLRETSRPRLRMLWIITVCSLVTVLVSRILLVLGMKELCLRTACGILVSWPVFMGFILRDTAEMWSRLREARLSSHHGTTDDFAEQQVERLISPETEEAIGRGIGSGLQQAQGFGCVILILLALASAGTWLIWQLIVWAPTLFAETILDRHLSEASPNALKRVRIRDWRKEVVPASLGFFLAIAVIGYAFIALLTLLIASAHGSR